MSTPLDSVPEEASYQEETEKFLEESDDIREEYGTTFTDVTCEEPGSVDVGQTYTCTAVAEDGSTWDFDAEIDGENSYLVVGTKRE